MAEMTYGRGNTIHQNDHLDVELDARGNVVAVWFRCLRLPFETTAVGADRAVNLKDQPVDLKLVAVIYESEGG